MSIASVVSAYTNIATTQIQEKEMKFRIVKRSRAPETFRVAAIMGKYDIPENTVVERFTGEIPIEKDGDWQVGAIVGNSGTGKTLIARDLFGEEYIDGFKYDAACVIEDMPRNVNSEQIARTLNSVGFSSVTSWLKPYKVLSNGEKMRVDLARAMLEDRPLIVFDEFTSVIDRVVAKVGSAALAKAVRRTDKKFVAVSCHRDILEWLEPDWVFDTNHMQYTFTRGSLQRPRIDLAVFKTDKHDSTGGLWRLFGKYHYLSGALMRGSEQYCAFHEGNPVAFCAVTHVVHKIRNMKRIHRLVVIPDYQGLGIGRAFLSSVARRFVERGFKMFLRTSNPALVMGLDNERPKHWILRANAGRTASHGTKKHMNAAGANNRLTTSWEYVL